MRAPPEEKSFGGVFVSNSVSILLANCCFKNANEHINQNNIGLFIKQNKTPQTVVTQRKNPGTIVVPRFPFLAQWEGFEPYEKTGVTVGITRFFKSR